MKTIKNDYCIRQFVGHDNLRPQFAFVSHSDGYLYATNSHMAAKISAGLCVKNYTAVDGFPNVEKVFTEHVSIETRTVSVDQLFAELMEIEVCFRPKLIDCDECDGTGRDTCEYCDSEHECKNCSGTGEVKSHELELSGESNCKIFKRKYKLHYLDLIIRTAIYTGVKEIEISNANAWHGAIFKVGDFSILLMPVNE